MSRNRWRAVALLVVAVIALAACGPRPAPPPPVITDSSAETRIELFNAHGRLTGFNYINDVGASLKAQWVAKVNASSSTCGPLIHSTNLLAWYPTGAGENLFCWTVSSGCPSGRGAAEAAVRAWIASPTHFAVMQKFNGKHLGVGAACRNGVTWFAVAHFFN